MDIYVVYFILVLSLLMLMYIVKNNQPSSENTIIAYPILAEIIFWGISIKKSY